MQIVVSLMVTGGAKIRVGKLNTQYVAVEKRGVIMEKTGTMIAYDSLNLMSVVIKVNSIDHTLNDSCTDILQQVKVRYQQRIDNLRDITGNILDARDKLTTNNLCLLAYNKNCSDVDIENNHKRKKRFAGVAIASAALGVAGTALGLSISNKLQIEKINSYLKLTNTKIDKVVDQLTSTNDRQAAIIDSQARIIGYIKSINERLDTLLTISDCWGRYIYYSTWANNVLYQVESLLTFVLKGDFHGKLTPVFLSPSQLKSFVTSSMHSPSRILTSYPTLMYNTAQVSLIEADFQSLTFRFFVSYPKLDNNPLYPFFSVSQTGFYLQPHGKQRHAMCVQFDIPQYAILKSGNYHFVYLNEPCPIIGSLMTCPQDRFRLSEMKTCLKMKDGDPSDKCELKHCMYTGDRYVSTPAGIILRSNVSAISVVVGKTSTLDQTTSSKMTVNMTSTGTKFIPWNSSISSVQYRDNVIYAPDFAETTAIIDLPTMPLAEQLNLSDIYSISGSEQLAEELHKHVDLLLNLKSKINISNQELDDIKKIQPGHAFGTINNTFSYVLIAATGVCTLVMLVLLVIVIRGNCKNSEQQHPKAEINVNIQEAHPSPEQKVKQVKKNMFIKLFGKRKSEEPVFLPLTNIEIPTSAQEGSNDLQVVIQRTQPQDYDPGYSHSQYDAYPLPHYDQTGHNYNYASQLYPAVIPEDQVV